MNTTSIALLNNISQPIFGFGTWRSNKGEVETAVYIALCKGYRHIDCAAIYNNQIEVGNGIKKFLNERKDIKRSDLFIVSKLWNSEHRPKDIEKACRKTLKELDLEYLDQYLIHWPVSFYKQSEDGDVFPTDYNGKTIFDNVPIKDTYQAMEKLVDLGLIRSLGVSNFTIELIDEVLEYAKFKPVVNQVECHVYFQQNELFKYLTSKQMALVAYCPLGNIDRKRFESCLDNETIIKLAEKYNCSPANILISFNLQRGIICIPKSVTPSRIEENTKHFTLDAADFDTLVSLDRNIRQCNPEWVRHIFAQP